MIYIRQWPRLGFKPGRGLFAFRGSDRQASLRLAKHIARMERAITTLRRYADWIRTIGRTERRNDLDAVREHVERLEARVVALRNARRPLADRAAHAAWVAASTGQSPDEIASAVRKAMEAD